MRFYTKLCCSCALFSHFSYSVYFCSTSVASCSQDVLSRHCHWGMGENERCRNSLQSAHYLPFPACSTWVSCMPVPFWLLDLSSGYSICLLILSCGSGTQIKVGQQRPDMLWSFRSLHTSSATFPRTLHMNFACGEKVSPHTRSSLSTPNTWYPQPGSLGTER